MGKVSRYLTSLPERTTRAAVAVAAGTIREASEIVLPAVIRRSKLYQATISRLLRIAIELIGDVRGVYPDEVMPVNELAVRKAAGNVVELASVVAVGWSPLWVLAAASDLLGGSKAYVRALVDELEAARLLPPGTDVTSYEELLTKLEATSGGLADAVDVPPLNVAAARTALANLRRQADDLPSPTELAAIFGELQATARREERSVAELSASVGLAAARAGVELGNVHVFDYYRRAFAAIADEGILSFLRRIAAPYRRRAVRHFDPAAATYTDRALRWLDRRSARPVAVESDGTGKLPLT